MKNLKKSFIIITALGSIASLYASTIDYNGTISGGPERARMIGGKGGIYQGNSKSPQTPTRSQSSTSISIEGLTDGTKGFYNPKSHEAVLYSNGSPVQFTNVVLVSKAIRVNLPKGAIPFGKMLNPNWSGKRMMGGERQYTTLYGIPAETLAATPATATPARTKFNTSGGIFRGVGIYGFEAGQKGLYDPVTKMANLDGTEFKVVSEYTPFIAGTMVPQTIQQAKLIAYMNGTAATTKKSFGGTNTKTYLYGFAVKDAA